MKIVEKEGEDRFSGKRGHPSEAWGGVKEKRTAQGVRMDNKKGKGKKGEK